MKQTRQFIEVYVRRGLHKVSVQWEPQKNLVLEWFGLYNLKCHKPSKIRILSQSCTRLDYITCKILYGSRSYNLNQLRIWAVSWSTRLAHFDPIFYVP